MIAQLQDRCAEAVQLALGAAEGPSIRPLRLVGNDATMGAATLTLAFGAKQMFTWLRTIDASGVAAISSAAVSCVALFVSIWTAVVAAKHNRIATRPQLRIDYRHGLEGPLLVVLSNRGLGPAIIDRFTVLLDSKPIQDTAAAGLKHALETLGVIGPFYAFTPSPMDVVSAGEELPLLELPIAGDPAQRHTIARGLSRISFVVDFHSIYGERDQLERNGNGMPLAQTAGTNSHLSVAGSLRPSLGGVSVDGSRMEP